MGSRQPCLDGPKGYIVIPDLIRDPSSAVACSPYLQWIPDQVRDDSGVSISTHAHARDAVHSPGGSVSSEIRQGSIPGADWGREPCVGNKPDSSGLGREAHMGPGVTIWAKRIDST